MTKKLTQETVPLLFIEKETVFAAIVVQDFQREVNSEQRAPEGERIKINVNFEFSEF